MKHITIDYGIDLGTTNSSICRMNEGVPTILRSDSGMETMPSCVSFKKNGSVNVGSSAYNELGNSRLRALKRKSATGSNSCIEFKRYMGSDKSYSDTFTDHLWNPEELSALVLKTLCSFAGDDEVKAAVITVPAKFTVNQKDATLQAAHLAGIEQVELLQEPIAASMAYGLKAEDKNGIWMVFDLGGGTLDVALVHVTDGIMQVFDTEGDNYLGGKNIDEAIVSKIILPELLSRFAIDISDTQTHTLLCDALKVVAEKLKNALSYKESETLYLEAGDWGEDDDGEEIELELTVTRQQVEDAMRPILQKAVDVCKTLMLRNNVNYGKLSHLILIGGPTYIPLLREMLREQVTENVETRIDPMTAVAQGAAIYASTLPVKKGLYGDETGSDIALDVAFEATTIDEEAYVTVKSEQVHDNLEVFLLRRSDGWQSESVSVGEKGALLIAELLPDQPNVFRICALLDGNGVSCYPSEITIVQGTKTGSAILPYNIGIEVHNPKNGRREFTSLTGLEKNRPLPATGSVYGLKTMSNIMGGDENDNLRIAIYQGDKGADGKTAALFEYVADVIITGEDIISYIPQGSQLNVFINVDRSEMMTVKCEFPEEGITVEKSLDTSKRQTSLTPEYLRDILRTTTNKVLKLNEDLDSDDECEALIARLREIGDTLDAGGQPKQIEQHLKEVMRKIETIESESEWDRALNALKNAFASLQFEAAKRSGDRTIERMIESFEAQIDRVTELRDVRKANFLQHQIEEYENIISRDERYRNFIYWTHRDFSRISWEDAEAAQKYVMKGMAILKNNPQATQAETNEIVSRLCELIVRSPYSTDNDSGEPDMPSINNFHIPSR